jgi:N-acetylglucosaminyldiphosphoundecaprenol N-acetyl-beta-D-mannosaminyltransferase
MTAIRQPGLLGIRVGVSDLRTLVDASLASIESRAAPFTFACANPHSLVVAQSDAEFRSALDACSAVVADGVGLTMASKLVGANVGPRITGTDYFLGLMSQLDRRGGRVFFLGSTDYVLKLVLAKTNRQFPNLHITVLSPPYGSWSESDTQKVLDAIREARPDVLWVGMTAPKQEKWVHRFASQVGVPVIGSVGAVFDYYAETVQRAPEWYCRNGLEWLYRLLHEPKRLWRRTLISTPAFLWLVVRRHVF